MSVFVFCSCGVSCRVGCGVSAVSGDTTGCVVVLGACVEEGRGVWVGEGGALCGLRFLSVEPLLVAVWLWGLCVVVVVVVGGEDVWCGVIFVSRGGTGGSDGSGVCCAVGSSVSVDDVLVSVLLVMGEDVGWGVVSELCVVGVSVCGVCLWGFRFLSPSVFVGVTCACSILRRSLVVSPS